MLSAQNGEMYLSPSVLCQISTSCSHTSIFVDPQQFLSILTLFSFPSFFWVVRAPWGGCLPPITLYILWGIAQGIAFLGSQSPSWIFLLSNWWAVPSSPFWFTVCPIQKQKQGYCGGSFWRQLLQPLPESFPWKSQSGSLELPGTNSNHSLSSNKSTQILGRDLFSLSKKPSSCLFGHSN